MPQRDAGHVEHDRAWRRQLRRPALIAGWVCVAVLCGYLYVAFDREPNHRFVPLLVTVLVLLVAALCAGSVVRSRRRCRGEVPED
jgi:membrane protein YdbS with pleckstrin-like domain